MHVLLVILLAGLPQSAVPAVPQLPVVGGRGGGGAAQGRDPALLTRPPVVGTGGISGIVVNESGRPVKGARVALSGSPVGRSTMTDASGAFQFDKLPEGRYQIAVSRQRFLSGTFGQKKPGRTGTPVQLADGEIKKGLTVTLFSPAVITGMVLGDDGEPVQNAQVRAMRWSMQTGVRRLQSSNSVQTDDRGIYRIYGLTPGDYVISAQSNQADISAQQLTIEMAMAMEKAMADAQASGARPDVTFQNGVLTLPGGTTMEPPSPMSYAPTYYPTSSTPGGAATVTVRSGEERQGVDIALLKMQTATISGMVTGFTGPGSPSINVQLQPVEDSGGISQGTRVTPDGHFTFRGVPPGTYLLTARSTTSVRLAAPAPVAAGASIVEKQIVGQQMIMTQQEVQTGRAQVAVNGQPVDNVVIVLGGGRSVSGRVVFEGGAPPDLTRIRMTVSLQPSVLTQANNVPFPQPAQIGADGTFKIANVAPGSYTLRASGVSGFSLKSSVVAGRDSLDFPFDLDGDDVTGALVTMVGNATPSELSGTITDQQLQPAVDYTIVVFSSDQRFWMPGSRRIVALRPGTDGKFIARGLPPGDYQIAALADLEPGTQYDKEFLQQLLGASTRVTLAEGGRVTQDLRISGS